MPVSWEELKGGVVPADFTIGTVSAVLERREDAWSTRSMERARVDLIAWRNGMVTTRRRRAS